MQREVRNPIDNFIHALEDANLRASSSKHLSTSTTPQSHHKPSAHSTPAQRKERAAERLRELSHKSSFVSDALQFEQARSESSNSAFKVILNDVGGCIPVQANAVRFEAISIACELPHSSLGKGELGSEGPYPNYPRSRKSPVSSWKSQWIGESWSSCIY